MRNRILLMSSVLVLLILQVQFVYSQTTEFTYQGSLNVSNAPGNGNFDFEFLLFDAVSGGAQLGSTVALNNVVVANGVFSVKLNFGNQFISGANRFLEVRVRPSGQGGLTVLSPRQMIASSPYAIKSLGAFNAESATMASNSLQLGGVAANQYVLTIDPRMTDPRPPTAGSPSYIQNSTSQQASSSFNISSTGTANTFNALTHYSLGGFRILGNAGTNNLFAGVAAGVQNTTGVQNAFLGVRAGFANITGSNNTFVGMNAGSSNTTGAANTFSGALAGQSNTIGIRNAFFGESAGKFNTDGQSNSFVGRNAGLFNTEGDQNSFFGESAGLSNTLGNNNVSIGFRAGFSNTVGSNNTFVGAYAGEANGNSSENSFFGYRAGYRTISDGNAFFGTDAGLDNTSGYQNSFFGSRAGFRNTTGINNTFVGVGAGSSNTTGAGNAFVGMIAGQNNSVGISNAFVGESAGYGNTSGFNNAFFGRYSGDANVSGHNNTVIGADADVLSSDLSFATAIGANAVAPTSNSITLGRSSGADLVRIPGSLALLELSTGGITPLCRNAFSLVATCSSSARYKSNIARFERGLDLIRRLRPVSFSWNDGGKPDLGLVAEDVARIEPLLTTTNDKGEVEGVKYDRVGVALINAVKEQQNQIEQLQRENRALRKDLYDQRYTHEEELKAFRKILCELQPAASVCKALN